MRAMRINAKKKECANAPIGPFTTFSHCVYDYNIRNELVSATKNAKGAEVLEYQYQYSTNSLTPNSSTPSLISMSYDRMGRRVTKNDQRFVYDGYLQIANFEHQTSNIKLQTFVWDPTEPVATRPLVWGRDGAPLFYTHDGNKNVSEVMASDGGIAAHYEYAPFGALTVSFGASAVANPWRFSSEYADVDVAMACYNFRHYNNCQGRWMVMDPLGEILDINLYKFLNNSPPLFVDLLGLFGDGYYGNNGEEKDKGHRNLGNPENFVGECAKPDYAKEDKLVKLPITSPFIAPWLHFQNITESENELSTAVSTCDIEKYQAYAHRMQDYFAHYGQKYRWFLFGHIFDSLFYFIGNYAEPDNPIDYKYDFDEANRRTLAWEGLWKKCCCCKYIGNVHRWVRDVRTSNIECKSNPNLSPPTVHRPSKKRMPNIIPRTEDIRNVLEHIEIKIFPDEAKPGVLLKIQF
jgi:RHS repeat-associated protein